MPKRNFVSIQLPAVQPDCCADCPLCGLVPNHLKPKGSFETHVCTATMEALTRRFIRVRASQRDSHHPLHRPCDDRWDAWMQLPGRKFNISTQIYSELRFPYEQTLQLQIRFHKWTTASGGSLNATRWKKRGGVMRLPRDRAPQQPPTSFLKASDVSPYFRTQNNGKRYIYYVPYSK